MELLKFEFVALSLKRSKDIGHDFDRVRRLLDEFNFLTLSGQLDLPPQMANNPQAKSSVYQVVRSVSRRMFQLGSPQ